MWAIAIASWCAVVLLIVLLKPPDAPSWSGFVVMAVMALAGISTMYCITKGRGNDHSW
jgi:hypothetical protein